MKLSFKLLSVFLLCFNAYADDLPKKYTELLDYVQEAPDQGETDSCLFVASTGAMELIANKHNNIKNPRPYGKYDLSESYLMNAPYYNSAGKYSWEATVLKFNAGYGIHIDDWPYVGWEGTDVGHVWNFRDYTKLPHVTLPQIETIPLFVKGSKWSTNVLAAEDVQTVKEALWKYRSPILINYNDSDYWHVILIVGYDDEIPGDCYQITNKECDDRPGAFYVRDSFGRVVEVRDYDWFQIKGNAAFVVKEK